MTMAQVLAVSNADVLDWFEGTDHVNGAPAPTFAAYPSVADYASLQYADISGNITYLTLPAPKSAIFKADGVTVDPAAIAALNAAVSAEIITAAGGAVVVYIGGIRRGSRPNA